ncbi:MarR family winged helix-turn-helix transcriptional regulator [Amorphus sp. MBR-141]
MSEAKLAISKTEQSATGEAIGSDDMRARSKEMLHAIPTVRIFVLSHIATRLAETNYGQLAGLRLTEARLLLVMGVYGPSKLERIRREISIEKGLASRSVSSLVERGLVCREPHRTDGRAAELTLTEDGHALFRDLYDNISAWNADWLSVLTKVEQNTFLDCVDRLIKAAREKACQQHGSRDAGPAS